MNAAASSNARATATVLVVEDNYVTRTLLEQTLEFEGYDVVALSDGADVVPALRESMASVVVLDVMMPGIDGFAVLEQIRSDEQTRDVPVLMLTALDDLDSTWNGWTRGCDYYMNKPFDGEDLVALVGSLTKGRS